ncbi:MAG: hypothetical protein ACLVEJ_13775 [Parabacteroides sp.]
MTVSAEKYPGTNINALFTPANKSAKHAITVKVESSNLSFTIDGKALTTTSAAGTAATPFNVGPWGNTHDQEYATSLGVDRFCRCAVGMRGVRYADYQIKNLWSQ